VAAVAATGTPIVLVVAEGRPRLLKTLVNDCDAIIDGASGFRAEPRLQRRQTAR